MQKKGNRYVVVLPFCQTLRADLGQPEPQTQNWAASPPFQRKTQSIATFFVSFVNFLHAGLGRLEP